MVDTSLLIWGMVFGSIGLGYFAYGKKQRALVPFLVGIGLFIFPYFISNIYILLITGTGLALLPYFIRL